MNKLGIYIHVPFCLRKCLYCDFCSKRCEGEEEMHAYTEAVLKEMRAQAPIAKDYTADTVFFGGGTPILLPLSDTERLMKEIRTLFTLTPDAEITMEANPGAADEKKLSALRALGINRLSIGVQSLSEAESSALKAMIIIAAVRNLRSLRWTDNGLGIC